MAAVGVVAGAGVRVELKLELVLDGEAAEVAGAERVLLGVGVGVVVEGGVVVIAAGRRVGVAPGAPAVAAGKDVLDALVGRELARLT